jgi:hypothetical protein
MERMRSRRSRMSLFPTRPWEVKYKRAFLPLIKREAKRYVNELVDLGVLTEFAAYVQRQYFPELGVRQNVAVKFDPRVDAEVLDRLAAQATAGQWGSRRIAEELAGAVHDASSAHAFEKLGVREASWLIDSPEYRDAINTRANLLANGSNEQHRQIKDIVRHEIYDLGGGPISPKVVARIQATSAKMANWEAERIGRTEVTAVASKAAQTTFAANQIESKQWITRGDSHVRAAHSDMANEIVPITEAFSNGMMYPGDGSGGASNSVNCRCVMVPVVPAEFRLDTISRGKGPEPIPEPVRKKRPSGKRKPKPPVPGPEPPPPIPAPKPPRKKYERKPKVKPVPEAIPTPVAPPEPVKLTKPKLRDGVEPTVKLKHLEVDEDLDAPTHTELVTAHAEKHKSDATDLVYEMCGDLNRVDQLALIRKMTAVMDEAYAPPGSKPRDGLTFKQAKQVLAKGITTKAQAAEFIKAMEMHRLLPDEVKLLRTQLVNDGLGLERRFEGFGEIKLVQPSAAILKDLDINTIQAAEDLIRGGLSTMPISDLVRSLYGRPMLYSDKGRALKISFEKKSATRAGSYFATDHSIVLSSNQPSVVAHEFGHSVHDTIVDAVGKPTATAIRNKTESQVHPALRPYTTKEAQSSLGALARERAGTGVQGKGYGADRTAISKAVNVNTGDDYFLAEYGKFKIGVETMSTAAEVFGPISYGRRRYYGTLRTFAKKKGGLFSRVGDQAVVDHAQVLNNALTQAGLIMRTEHAF